MKKYILTLCILTLSYQAAGAVNEISGNTQLADKTDVNQVKYTVTENHQWKIQLSDLHSSSIDSENTHNSTDILVMHKGTHKEWTQTLNTAMTAIDEVNIYKNKLVVFGSISSSANGVMIIDIKGERDPEFILCYQPSISPSGRYILYKLHYPRFAPAEYASDVLLKYDLDMSPEKNKLEKPLIQNINYWDKKATDTGIPVFPLIRSYTLQFNKSPIRINNQYLWEPEERSLIVLTDDKHGSTSPTLQKHTVSRSGDTVLVKQLNLSSYLSMLPDSIKFQESSNDAHSSTTASIQAPVYKVTDMGFGDSGIIKLELNSAYHISVDVEKK